MALAGLVNGRRGRVQESDLGLLRVHLRGLEGLLLTGLLPVPERTQERRLLRGLEQALEFVPLQRPEQALFPALVQGLEQWLLRDEHRALLRLEGQRLEQGLQMMLEQGLARLLFSVLLQRSLQGLYKGQALPQPSRGRRPGRVMSDK